MRSGWGLQILGGSLICWLPRWLVSEPIIGSDLGEWVTALAPTHPVEPGDLDC